MPQGPLTVSVAQTPEAAASRALNITAPTVVKATKGRLAGIFVVVAGTTAGAVYDNNQTGGSNTAANQIAAAPATLGYSASPGFPCNTGIVVVPGTGQTLAVSFT